MYAVCDEAIKYIIDNYYGNKQENGLQPQSES